MNAIAEYWRLATGALLLRSAPYEQMRDARQPFVKGFILILITTFVVAVVAIAGHALNWATAPNLDEAQEIVWEGMTEMPWFQELERLGEGEVLDTVRVWYDAGWQGSRFFAPAPWRGASDLIAKPVGALVCWLIYGILAYLFARLLGGEGSLGQTYGCLALAISPQLLGLLHVLPYVATGGAISIWTAVCGFIALKTTHRLSGGRAFWVAVLPTVTLVLLVLLLTSVFTALMGAVAGNLIEWLAGMGG